MHLHLLGRLELLAKIKDLLFLFDQVTFGVDLPNRDKSLNEAGFFLAERFGLLRFLIMHRIFSKALRVVPL